MATVFADSAYYVALLVPGDNLRPQVERIVPTLRGVRIVTSQPVLVEVLAHISRMGPHTRALAARMIDELDADPIVTAVPQTPELFEDGLRLYRERTDKTYSLTDCMSMTICKRLGITDVLTHDRHFSQEGFEIRL